jgi:dUTP pyrophosphatase
LKSAYDVIPAGENAMIQTDLAIQMHAGCYGRITPRSGLAWHHKISVMGGVVDEDYRGAICVILFNHSKTSFYVNRGLRVAQLICEKICYPELIEVEEIDDDRTWRWRICIDRIFLNIYVFEKK